MNRKLIEEKLGDVVWFCSEFNEAVWTNVSDLHLLLLYFAATVGIFTPGQAIRYLRSINSPLSSAPHKEIHEVLEHLTLGRGWLGFLSGVRLPRDCSGGITTVYYLRPLGGKMVEKKFPDHFRIVRTGRPEGTMRRRIGHDLLVTEAYVHVLKSRKVRIFLCERELQSLIRRARLSAGEASEDVESGGETCGDFMLFVEHRDGTFRWMECEVTRKLDYGQVRSKPDGMTWFVSEEVKKDTVEAAKGTKSHVILLGNVCEPCSSEYCPDPPQNIQTIDGPATSNSPSRVPYPRQQEYWNGLTPRQQLLIRELRRLDAATIDALAVMLELEPSGVRKRVKELEKAGYIAIEKVHLHPGLDVGKRPYLCRPAYKEPLQSLAARAFHLMISIAITKLGRAGLTLSDYYKTTGTIEMRCDTEEDLPPHFIVVDDQRRTIEELKERFISTCTSWPEGRVLLFMTAPNRIAEMRQLYPGVEIIDFSMNKN